MYLPLLLAQEHVTVRLSPAQPCEVHPPGLRDRGSKLKKVQPCRAQPHALMQVMYSNFLQMVDAGAVQTARIDDGMSHIYFRLRWPKAQPLPSEAAQGENRYEVTAHGRSSSVSVAQALVIVLLLLCSAASAQCRVGQFRSPVYMLKC